MWGKVPIPSVPGGVFAEPGWPHDGNAAHQGGVPFCARETWRLIFPSKTCLFLLVWWLAWSKPSKYSVFTISGTSFSFTTYGSPVTDHFGSAKRKDVHQKCKLGTMEESWALVIFLGWTRFWFMRKQEVVFFLSPSLFFFFNVFFLK